MKFLRLDGHFLTLELIKFYSAGITGNWVSFCEIGPYWELCKKDTKRKPRNYCVAVRRTKLLGTYGIVCLGVNNLVANKLES